MLKLVTSVLFVSIFFSTEAKLYGDFKSGLESFKGFSTETSTAAQRAQYVKELYYSVNGYPAGTDTSTKPQPHLEVFNLILGANGIGGILFGEGYETCADIPTSGSASGDVLRVGTLNLTFGAGTKTVPSYYTTDAGTTMDKRITVSGQVTLEIELKCNDSTAIQTGYVKMTYTDYNVVYEGYFQQNSNTGAANVDMYVKTQAGGEGKGREKKKTYSVGLFILIIVLQN
jgi:hypothetical protein